MLEIKNLTFSYSRQKSNVIDGMSMTFEQGGIYGLLGPNGAGKSTLLYLICGLLTPKRGSVTFNGVNTRLRRPATLADIFLVPEEFELPKMRLSQYIKIWQGFYPHFSYDSLMSNLRLFGLESDPMLDALSMGQKKKVYMCFALAANTSLLIMDEPTNGLDIPGKISFRSFIASNMTDTRTIILSTHQVQDITSLVDHVAIIDQHNLLLNASIADVCEHLAFYTTSDPEAIARALYSQPAINGYDVVLPATPGSETDVNLTTLYQLATTRPETTSEIFKTLTR